MIFTRIFLGTSCFLLFFLFSTIVKADGYKIKTVVIDAGHGGKDPGAIGYSKSKEKDITLAVSLKLGELIKQNYKDINVVYTRKSDVFIELQERAAIANKSNADLFISIHCNANDNKTVYGTETYCLGLHRTEANLEVAKRENSVIMMEDNYVEKYDGFDPNAAEAHIIFSLFQNAFLNQSVSLASKVDESLAAEAARKSRGVKQAGFLVLYKTTMPGVLIELGFISNKNEEAFLTSKSGQEKISLGIFKAFEAFRKESELLNKESQPEVLPNTTKENKQPETLKTPPPKPPVKVEEKTTPPPVPPVVEERKTSPAIPEKNKETLREAGEKIASDNEPATIFFKVQFAASKVKLPANEAPLSNVVEYEIEPAGNGYLRYLSGKFIDLNIAKEHQKVLQSLGFKDAFIVPYVQGVQRISMKTYLEQYQK